MLFGNAVRMWSEVRRGDEGSVEEVGRVDFDASVSRFRISTYHVGFLDTAYTLELTSATYVSYGV
jgi:hypothetical protein